MTFYDDYYEASMPNLPSYEFVLDDSPTCHQSLKYWTDRAAEVAFPTFMAVFFIFSLCTIHQKDFCFCNCTK